MARKDNTGYILPIIPDPPRKCVKIWIPDEVYHRAAFWGSIFTLTQAFNWQNTDTEEQRFVANLWFDIWSQATRENDVNGCCGDVAVTYRVNPDTGMIEQSPNGGTTWQPAANTLQQYIVEPVPPVTAGTSSNKCDAATNVGGQVDVWIDQVTNDFDTATTLLEFATAVLEAILVAVVAILSAGLLTAAELLVLPTISAACVAAFGAGKTVFVDYWTTDNKDKVLCAAFCNIENDGHFTDAGFSNFWHKCNADLPASPAKMLFMGFLSSVGRQGLNAMAATGISADADCSDCDCGGLRVFTWDQIAAHATEIFPDETGLYTGHSGSTASGGNYVCWVLFEQFDTWPTDSWQCWDLTIVSNGSGQAPFQHRCSDFEVDPLATCVGGYTYYRTSGPFDITFTIGDKCGQHP